MNAVEKDIEFRDILRSRQEGAAKLNEASLGRAYQHIQKAGDKSFGIVTSWRQVNPKKKNDADWKALQGQVRAAGLGFFKLLGHWKEEGQDESTKEPALFVPGISKELIAKLGKEYDQDAVIYAGPETEGEVVLLARSGAEDRIGKFHPGKIAQAYSALRGSTFTFEGFEYPAQSFVEKTAEQLFEKNLRTLTNELRRATKQE